MYSKLLVILLAAGHNNVLACFDTGECTRSLNIGHWQTYGADNCLTECQSHSECQYFTYYEDDRQCLGFVNCEELSQDSCENCYSGDRNCEGLQCGMPGQCDGIYLDEQTVNDHAECYQACQLNADCTWLTYDREHDLCLLYQSCPFIDQRCETCTSSQSLCVPTEYSKIMVIAGFNDEVTYLKDVDVLDLASDDNQCDPVTDLPLSLYGNDAIFYDSQVINCGGFNVDYQDTCFVYDPHSNSWNQMESMLIPRAYHRSSIIQGVWFITGGQLYTSRIYGKLNSTEVWDGNSFAFGPELPEPMVYHCQVTLNETHIFLADIDLQYDGSGNTYLLNWEDKTWTQLATLTNLKPRPACGLARSDNAGTEIVAVGDGKSDIFSMETLEWRQGPDQSFPTSVLTSAQLRTTFLVIGGSVGDSNETVRKVYRYVPGEETFELLEQELEVPRSEAAAVAVPDNGVVNCES